MISRAISAPANSYARRGIPYRRGYLFHGPPVNRLWISSTFDVNDNFTRTHTHTGVHLGHREDVSR